MPNLITITDFSAPELDIYARTPEVQLLRMYEPMPGVFLAESPKVIERALNAGYEPISFLADSKQIEGEGREILARCEGVPVYTAESSILTQLTGFALTRGMLCAMKRRTLPTVEEICASVERQPADTPSAGQELRRSPRRIAILENVVNPTNVGAIFRSAAALGMDAVLLTPGCADPLYRRASRVSMGTVFQIPWTYFPKADKSASTLHEQSGKKAVWPEAALSALRQLGFKTAAMAVKKDSVSIDDPNLLAEEKLAIILGTEGDGLAADTIADCDYTVMIPMTHGVDSLNVAAASAVAFWQLSRR